MRARAVSRFGGQAVSASPSAKSAMRHHRSALSAWLEGALRTLRRVAGMPDYLAYVEHLRSHHPDRTVPTEREFFTLFTESRYGPGPTRCC
jgi:uncharacterized short protein YbdD (DUF466 family)